LRLVLLRHAIAEEVCADDPGNDFARRLTLEGRRKLKRVLRCYARLGSLPPRIYTSPLVRARQTASQAGRFLDLPVLLSEALVPGGDAFGWLRQCDEEHLMVVGHEPDLSFLAARFLGLQFPCFSIKKSGMVGLEGDPGRGRLLWLVTPKWSGTQFRT